LIPYYYFNLVGLGFKTIYGINNIEVLGKKSYSKRWFFLNPVKLVLLLLSLACIFSLSPLLVVFLYASGATTVKAPASKARGIDRIIECLYKSRSTVSAVSIHALSAVTRITRLVFIFLILGCLYSCGIFLIPEVKFLKVTNKFATNPLLWSCSKTEQQLQISEVNLHQAPTLRE
jgi:hypothetical protein